MVEANEVFVGRYYQDNLDTYDYCFCDLLTGHLSTFNELRDLIGYVASRRNIWSINCVLPKEEIFGKIRRDRLSFECLDGEELSFLIKNISIDSKAESPTNQNYGFFGR